MPDSKPQLELAAEIDARQDEILQQLEELSRRLENCLAEFAGRREATDSVKAA